MVSRFGDYWCLSSLCPLNLPYLAALQKIVLKNCGAIDL
jgi:hypothetical protein